MIKEFLKTLFWGLVGLAAMLAMMLGIVLLWKYFPYGMFGLLILIAAFGLGQILRGKY